MSEPNQIASTTAESAAPSVAFITMGCAKNEVDSADMSAKLADAGYRIEVDPEQADVVIVNTCSFIQAATEESIDAVLEASAYENVASGKSKLIVAGCMPARYGADLESELAEASSFVPCSKEDDIVDVIDRTLSVSRASFTEDAAASRRLPAPASAYVKISDGCDRFCAYCSIPYIRGRYHSFTAEQIEADVADLVQRGTREIVLIAQDTGRWGQDFDEPSTLAWLVDHLAKKFSTTWFRVMYIQPTGVTDQLIDAVAANDNVCDYFDVPFQHSDPAILKAMNRTGSALEHIALVERIRKRIPDATIRTTLIAGFPGETDEQFEDLCDFVEECDLDYIGVFAYSREEGTRAYHYDDQVDDDEKMERAQRLRDLADDVCTPRIAQRIGSTMDVLVLGTEEDGQLYGRAQCQAPDVDGVTYVDAGKPGEFTTVRIDDTLMYEMEGSEVE